MVRKRVPLQLIPKDTSRRRTCRSRKNNLMKKAHEFRILCGVSTCVIIYDPENPTKNPETYPEEREEVVSVIEKYFTTAGNRKMLGLPNFFEDRKRKAEKEVKKAREDNLKAKYPLPRDLIENLSRDQLRSLCHDLTGKITRAKNRLGGINGILTSGNNDGPQLNGEVSWGASNQANNSYMKNLVDLPSKQRYYDISPIQYPNTGQHRSLCHDLTGKITRAKNRLGGIKGILYEGVGLEPPLGFDSQLNGEVSWGASNQANNNSYMKNLVDLPSTQHYYNVSTFGNRNGTDFTSSGTFCPIGTSSGTFCNPGFLQYKENPNLFMQQPAQPVMQYMGFGNADVASSGLPGSSHSFDQYNYGAFGSADVASSGLPVMMLPAAAKMEWQKDQQASSSADTASFYNHQYYFG